MLFQSTSMAFSDQDCSGTREWNCKHLWRNFNQPHVRQISILLEYISLLRYVLTAAHCLCKTSATDREDEQWCENGHVEEVNYYLKMNLLNCLADNQGQTRTNVWGVPRCHSWEPMFGKEQGLKTLWLSGDKSCKIKEEQKKVEYFHFRYV